MMNMLNILVSWPDSPTGWMAFFAVVAVVLALCGAIAFTVFKLVENGKLEQLREAVVEAIKEAEKTHASGEEKKKIAIEVVKKFCEGIGLKLDDRLLAWVADYIEKYIRDHNELELIEEEEGK